MRISIESAPYASALWRTLRARYLSKRVPVNHILLAIGVRYLNEFLCIQNLQGTDMRLETAVHLQRVNLQYTHTHTHSHKHHTSS